MSRAIFAIIAGSFTVVLPVVVHGQAESDGTALAEIVVSAQKRTQSAQNVGIAISEVGGDEIRALKIQQPLDLAMVAPSLTTVNATTDGTPLFLIRGVGLDDFNNNNSSAVGTYIDEVFASFPGFLTGQLYDVDHVEILKGPQGTLYGKNTAGGAISVFSKKPTHDFEAYADLSYGRWQTTEFTGAVGGPLTDRLSARLAGSLTRQGEAFQRDIDTGRSFGKLNRGGARALFDIKIADRASVLFNFHYSYDQSVPSSASTPNVEQLLPLNLGFPTAGLLNSPPGGTLVRVGGLNLYKDERGDGAAATLNISFDAFSLTSITAFDEFHSRSLDNYDGYPAADDDWTKHFDQQQWSEEVRLTSPSDQFIDWVIGANASENWFHGRDSIDQTFVYGVAQSIPDSGKAVTRENFIQRQRSIGVFAHTETHLSQRWTAVAGLRYSADRTGFDGVNRDVTGLLTYSLNGFAGPIVPGAALAALDEAHSEHDISYKAGLEYHATKEILLYTSLATAYKAGIFYGQPAQVQPDWGYTKPEHVRSVELGLKSRFFADSLQFNAAGFHSDYRDRQSSLAVWSGPVGSLPIVAALGNMPRSRINGVEGDLVWRPIRGLELRAGGTYLDGRVTESTSDVRGLATYATILAGSRLPVAPPWSYDWLARYEHALVAGLQGYCQASDRWSGHTHGLLGDPNVYGPNHSLGVRAGLENVKDGWEASLWASNLSDNRSVTYAFSGSFGQAVSYYQKPRAYGVEVSYHFSGAQ